MNQSRGTANPESQERSDGASAPATVSAQPRSARATRVISHITHDSSGKRRLWAGPLGWVGMALAAAFLGVTALFGGLEPVEATPLPAGDTSTVVKLGLFDVTVDKAIVVEDGELIGVETASDEVAVVFKVTITNHRDDPVMATELLTTAALSDWLGERDPDLPDLPEIIEIEKWAPYADSVLRLDNDTLTSIWLQPEVPTSIGVIYIVSDEVLKQEDIEVTVNETIFKPYQVVLDSSSYSVEKGEATAVITVPLDEPTMTEEEE